MLLRLMTKHSISSLVFLFLFALTAIGYPVLLNQTNELAVYNLLTGKTQNYLTLLWWIWVLISPLIFSMSITANEMRRFFTLEFVRYGTIKQWIRNHLFFLMLMQIISFIPTIVVFIAISTDHNLNVLLSSLSLFFLTAALWLTALLLVHYFRISTVVLLTVMLVVCVQVYMHSQQVSIGSTETEANLTIISVAALISVALYLFNLLSARASYFIEGGKNQ